MCGIAGIFAYRSGTQVDRLELLRIRDQMQARGPDGAGEWYSDDGRVALGHRRLAIIDLDERAAQPMASADGRLQISFNGEIYNYRELRAELERGGAQFRTESDTEVLLHLYARDGERMFAQLSGMYAFILWDARIGRVLLARDAYGIKPLYYADDGRCVRMASQVKALLAGGKVSTQVDPAGQMGFLLLGSVPEPHSWYSDVRAVPSGSFMWFDSTGARAPRPHFQLAQVFASAHRLRLLPEDAVERAREALRDTVRRHMVADVPVGAFLSGGVDSGGVVGLMRDVSSIPTLTVNIAFDEFRGSSSDESALAEAAAQLYGADHRTRVVTESEFRVDLPKIIAAMDQPSIDGINTWFAAKACKERGLKVALSGIGGDELFGSYPSFQSLPRWVAMMSVLSRTPGLGKVVRRLSFPLLRRQSLVSPKLSGMVEWGGFWEGAYLLRRGLFMPWELPELADAEWVEEGLRRLDWSHLVRRQIEPDPGSGFARVACLESDMYLRNQLLRDTDWASMAHSLEVRTPLVDAQLMRTFATLHPALESGDGKRWLAGAPSTPLPDSVVNRPKTGFQTPIGEWLLKSHLFEFGSQAERASPAGQHWSRRLATQLLHAPTFTAQASAAGATSMPALQRTLDVMHFQRKAFTISYSVERIFEDVREFLRSNAHPVGLRISRFRSKGLLRRMADIVGAALSQGAVNHVTGDVHYLTYLLHRRRTVLTVLDCVSLNRLHGFKRRALWLLWYWLPLRRCCYVTVISQFTKAELMREVKIDEPRLVVIYPSVSDEFMPAPAAFNAECPRILQIGTGSNKNLERVIRALRGLSCHLVIVGPINNEQGALLVDACIRFDNPVNLSRDELRDEYIRADLVVFASTYEGFGLPIIEANAVGRPVLTSNVCSMPEVAADAACIVDPYEVADIRAGIDRMISDRAYREQLVENGLRNVERFRIGAISRQYAALYARVDAENREPKTVAA